MLPRLTAQDPLELEPTPKRIRVYGDGRLLADSMRAKIVRPPFPPPRTYAFPKQDVLGPWPDGAFEVDGHVVIPWDAADHWLEESEEVHIHPRDPRQRIDVLPTDKHIQVAIDGEMVADTHRAVLLVEAWPALPVRYYIPPDDVRLELLRTSETRTGCPYKGWADYFDVMSPAGRRRDLVWVYRTPFREVDPIRGRYCFFNEHVDITVDGQAQERPQTPFS